jgi:DNA topoisomerase-1
VEKCTFVIAEKPDAAKRIAQALDQTGNPKRLSLRGVPYFEACRDSRRVRVVSALGHLYTVAGTKKRVAHQEAVFDYEWVPRYKAEPKASGTRIWLQALTELAVDAEEFVDACDFDIEGSIIGYCILKYACGDKEFEAKRMKYSTLTGEELQNSFANLLPQLEFGLIEAGLTRHEVDWLYGINLSRALTAAAKKHSKTYSVLSTGRVQGPTLKFLAERENSIRTFVPKKYWVLKAKVKIGEKTYTAEHENKTFDSQAEAENAKAASNQKMGTVEAADIQIFQLAPPFPFDLGALQLEAYRLFKYTPMRTLAIAQKLYLDALISYPRTSSQKLPASIGYEKILHNLAKNRQYLRLAGELLAMPKLVPNEGKKQDPAHPAIYPTGKMPEKPLVGGERNIYDLVVRRFLACFAEAAYGEMLRTELQIGSEKFVFTCKQVTDRGWLNFYESKAARLDAELPVVAVGDLVKVQAVVLEKKTTLPPPRYDAGSLLRQMEQANIGTKATRAGIMQTLYDRQYVEGEKIVVTTLGLEVTDVLGKYCPSVVSVEFTRQLEEQMELVQQQKEPKQKVISEAVENLKTVLVALRANEEAIGAQLGCRLSEARLEKTIIGPCPNCGEGQLVIQYSKKTKKRFVGCTNYFKGGCKTTFPLPQKGYVKPSGKPCKRCGRATVLVWLGRKRVWDLCLNPSCHSKKRKNGEAQTLPN